MRARPDADRWLSLDRAGEFLGFDSRLVRRLVKSKELPGLQTRGGGGRFLISRAACENFLRRMGEAIPDDDAAEGSPASCRPSPGMGSLRH
jgi:excisionase family DNA binding protein